MSLFKLFFIYVKIGAILLGGGYVILPILQHEFVDKLKVIEDDELINYYTLAQSMPGIVAANVSMFIGYELRGSIGAISAMLGIIFVPFWSIVLLAVILDKLVSYIYVQALFWGVGIAVIALIILTVREMWQKSNKDLFFHTIFLLTLIGLLIFKLSPINTIIIFSIIGIIAKMIQQKARREK